MSLPEDFKKNLERRLEEEAKRSLAEAKGRLELQHRNCEEKLESRAETLVKEFVNTVRD